MSHQEAHSSASGDIFAASVVVLYDDSYYLALRSPQDGKGVVGMLQRLARGSELGPSVTLAGFRQVEGGGWLVTVGARGWRLGHVATSIDAIAMLWEAKERIAALLA